MRFLLSTVGCLTMTAMSAFALDETFVQRSIQSARNIERDAIAVRAAIKSKNLDAADVRARIDAMSGDIESLQKLVADFEGTNPQLNDRERADWTLVKEKVQILEIFHGQKQQLASADVVRNRKMIQVHAKGVAERADRLHQTLLKLMRTPSA